MRKLVLATANPYKVTELKQLLHQKYELVTMEQMGITEPIAETGKTLEENALLKAKFVHNRLQLDCIAEDTGLEVVALHNEPGVYSARFAGEEALAANNIKKLLTLMEGKGDRRARFRTVICLILDGKEHLFEGEVWGNILHQSRGEGGFGYDPVFAPDGSDISFAEMPAEAKNLISHRAGAVAGMLEFLNRK